MYSTIVCQIDLDISEQTKAAAKGDGMDPPSAKDTVQQAADEVDREAAEKKSQELGDENDLIQNIIEDVEVGGAQDEQTEEAVAEPPQREEDEITLQPDTGTVSLPVET